MTSENTLTGRGGEFSFNAVKIARATNWDVSSSLATSNEWGDSDGAGFTNRSAGRKDATFNTEGKYDSVLAGNAFDVFQIGDIAAAILTLVTGTVWNFPRALCSEFAMTVNIDSEEVIGWTASHGADGTYTDPSGVAP